MRLDKYLKVARIIKRRTVANEACDAAHVTVNGKPAKASYEVREGDVLEAGQELTEGPVNPHDILKIKGIKGVQNYLAREVQAVYRLQGVEINDKHIEVTSVRCAARCV